MFYIVYFLKEQNFQEYAIDKVKFLMRKSFFKLTEVTYVLVLIWKWKRKTQPREFTLEVPV